MKEQSKRTSERTNGPVLTSGFLVVPAHSLTGMQEAEARGKKVVVARRRKKKAVMVMTMREETEREWVTWFPADRATLGTRKCRW